MSIASRIIAGHFQSEKDIDAYLGLEYDVIGIEEATTLSNRKHQDISTCCRTSKAGWRPRIYSTSNPGGIGHAWYRAKFVVPYLQMQNEKLGVKKGMPLTPALSPGEREKDGMPLTRAKEMPLTMNLGPQESPPHPNPLPKGKRRGESFPPGDHSKVQGFNAGKFVRGILAPALSRRTSASHRERESAPWGESIFVPARVGDNRFNNPEYAKVLEGLTGWQKRAWLDGDWDIAAGQYLRRSDVRFMWWVTARVARGSVLTFAKKRTGAKVQY